MTPPNAILFDFDGVLAASHRQHFAAWQLAIKELAAGELLRSHMSELSGLSPRRIAEALGARFGVSAEALYEEKLAHMFDAVAHIELLDGASELLAALATRQIPFGIASNSPRALVTRILAHHDLRVPVVLGHDDYTSPKPDPEAYIELGRRLGFESLAGCWVVEDSTPGLEAARRSGAGTVVGVTSYKHDHASLEKHGAHLSVDSPRELLARLDTL